MAQRIDAAQLVIKVTTDANKAARDVDKLKGKSSGVAKAFKAIKKVALPASLLAAAAGAVKLGAALARAGSDAEETSAKFNTVFRNIRGDATAAADALVDSFGQSSQGAQALLANTGDLLTGFGFTQEAALDLSSRVNQLAVDLASFTNFAGGAEGASEALTKALLGEAESAKQLGIVINQNSSEYKELFKEIKATTGAADTQVKALVALELATRQSGNAIGDFARTQDSFANQQRVLNARLDDTRAILGSYVSEGLRPLQKITIELVGGLNDWLEREKAISDIIAGRSVGTQEEYAAALERTREQILIAGADLAVYTELTRDQAIAAVRAGEIQDETLQGLIRQERIIENLTNATGSYLTFQEALNVATGGAISQAGRLTEINDNLVGSYESLILQLQFYDKLVGEDLISSEEAIQEKLDMRLEFQELLRQSLQDTGVWTERQAELWAANEAAIARYNEALAGTVETQGELNEEVDDGLTVYTEYFSYLSEQNQRAQAEISERAAEREEELQGIVAFGRTVGDQIGQVIQGQISLAEAAKNVLTDLVSTALNALAQDLLVRSAAAFGSAFIPPPIGTGPAGFVAAGQLAAAATAASVAAGIVGSFQNETPPLGFSPPPGTRDDTLIAVASDETVTVSKDGQQDGPLLLNRISIGEREIAEVITRALDSQQATVNPRAVTAR